MPAILVAVLILAGCESQPLPPPPIAAAPPRSAGPVRGVDLPTDASDILSELKTSRLDFVARYYRDPASRWPTLSAGEVQRLSALGLKIVTVWESHSRRPDYFSYASGYYDALSAYRQAQSVGQPAGSAIYFAVDFNARGPDLYRVDQYFRGVAAGFAAAGNGRPGYKVGVYGSGAVCAMMKGERLAQYAWLSGSTAWEGSSGYSGWNIRQADQGAHWAHLSFVHDANEATEDYGGFRLAGYDATPAPSVATAAAAPAAAAPQTPTDVAQQAPEPDHTLVGMIKSWF
ncbi:MAG TPA: glycoside hydrolase domain-containing protein [Stellaceae bacterium]|nr:glycoside hydrolase domain-containing protein [Stellaceae bacterium]